MKEVYMLTKTISNDKPKPAFAVKDKTGNLVTGHARTERWREHFEEVLNRPAPDNPVNEIVVEPVIHEISTEPITLVEIRTVLKRIKNGRAGGKDEITLELLKADMNITEEWLCSIFKDIWEKEKVPKAWKQGLIVKIPKNGSFTKCDFEKAFDSVHRDRMWKIMEAYGIPRKIINMVQILYEGTECAVLDGIEESDWFKVKTGVKQGDVMSGFIFLIIIDWIMKRTTEESNTGIRWRFTSKLEDLDFADDIALVSPNCQQLQIKATKLSQFATQTGLKINKKKSEVLRINSN
ncbi:uncharacterized protein LOC117124965, partial [Anneissia japonica]|uniref:uncharacterized protein LOC117124965 n=1 Tax=Anneissia japonica TaxID=1529436 RepID=UPI0014258E51